MGVPDLVVFDEVEVHRRIWSEVARYPDHETGGMLVGQHMKLGDKHVLVVVAATGPGDAADHQETTFAPDTRSLQLDLERWRARYAHHAIDYVGEWHKHPPGYHQPSQGDIEQAARILADPGYYVPHGILTPIVTVEASVLRMHVHYFGVRSQRPITFQAAQVMSVTDQMDDVLAMLAGVQHQAHAQPSPRWGVDPERLMPSAMESDVEDAVDWQIEEGEAILPGHPRPSDELPVEEAVLIPSDDRSHNIPVSMAFARIGREHADLRRATKTLRIQVGPLHRDGVFEIALPEQPHVALLAAVAPDTTVSDGGPADAGAVRVVALRVTMDTTSPAVLPRMYLQTSIGRYLQIDLARLLQTTHLNTPNLTTIVAEIVRRVRQQPQSLTQFLPHLSQQIGLAITRSELVVRRLADVLHAIDVQLQQEHVALPIVKCSEEEAHVSHHSRLDDRQPGRDCG